MQFDRALVMWPFSLFSNWFGLEQFSAAWAPAGPLLVIAVTIAALIFAFNVMERAFLDRTALDWWHFRPWIVRLQMASAMLAVLSTLYLVTIYTSTENVTCLLLGFTIIAFDIRQQARRSDPPWLIGVLFTNAKGEVALTLRGSRNNLVKQILYDESKSRFAAWFANGRFEPFDAELPPNHQESLIRQAKVLIVELDRNGHMIREYVVPAGPGEW